jgi:hypothetical protein
MTNERETKTMDTKERQGMTLERFRGLVAAYGAESGRWPEPDRDAARALAASSEEARAIVEQALALDLALGALAPPAPSGTLERRLAGLGPRRAVRRRRLAVPPFLRGFGGMAAGAGLAAAAAMSLWLVLTPAPGTAPVAPSLPASVVVAQDDGGTSLLDGVAMVDTAADFVQFSESDLGTDSVAGSSGQDQASASGDFSGLALE